MRTIARKRSGDSALAQLEGLYKLESKWPYPETGGQDVFKIHTVEDEHDTLLHAHSNSTRYKYITKSVEKAHETKKMMKAFDNDMERSGFFPALRERIRQATGVEIESTAEMKKVCN